MTSNDAGWGHIPVAAFELPVNRASKAVTGADKMPTAQQHSIGKPLGISKLKKPRAVRGVSRRHQAPERAITLAAARRPSQVVRFFFDPGKQEVGTVNATLVRIGQGSRVTRSAALPTWETFMRFLESDDLGMVLRCHLALEAALNKVIEIRARPHRESELDRLPFVAKVDVCIALGAIPVRKRRAWVLANRIRNQFAHDLGATLQDEQADDLEKALGWPWRTSTELESIEAQLSGWPHESVHQARELLAKAATARQRVALYLGLLYIEAWGATRLPRSVLGAPDEPQ